MSIKRLTPKDSLKAAYLHCHVLPDISATLGLSFVNSLYATLFKNPTHFSLGFWDKNDLRGVIVGSENMHITHRLLHSLFTPKIISSLITRVLAGRVSPFRLLQRILFENKTRQLLPKNYPSIVIVCVDKRYQRKGIGKTMVQRIVNYFREKKLNYLYVDTRTDNLQAINFYRKLGFKITSVAHNNIIFKIPLTDFNKNGE